MSKMPLDRRLFLGLAAVSPAAFRLKQESPKPQGFDVSCAVHLIQNVRKSLNELLNEVLFVDYPVTPSRFDHWMGRLLEVRLELSFELSKLPVDDQKQVVKQVEPDRVILADQLARYAKLVPAPGQLVRQNFLADSETSIHSESSSSASLRPVSLQELISTKCGEEILLILAETLFGEQMTKALHQWLMDYIKSDVQGTGHAITAQDWKGLRYAAEKMLEKLLAKEAIEELLKLVGETVGGELLGRLSTDFVPFVGDLILVITFVAVVRRNWKQIETKC